MAAQSRVLVYVVRRDLRVSDNPVLHHLASSPDHGFTHLIPVYVLSAQQIDLSGLIRAGSDNPHPKPTSQVGNYPRCGPHRAKFLAEAAWDLRESLESLGSGLVIRAGMTADVVTYLAQDLTGKGFKVAAVWMTSHEGTEEKHDERAVASACRNLDAEYKLWEDEKYLIDEDVGLENLNQLSDIFTTFRKSQEPLREKPRAVLPAPMKGSLPPLPDLSTILGQTLPFNIPDSVEGLIEALIEPVKHFLPNIPAFPENAESAHPFQGGETAAQARLNHLIQSGCATSYKDSRNGLLGTDFSTKLSAYLAQGCITSRQVHHRLLSLEDGIDITLEDVDGYGAGENGGTQCIRLELLWRDYMRLCHQKFGNKVFYLEGTRDPYRSDAGEGAQETPVWKTPAAERAAPDQDPDPARIAEILDRFNAGTTGMGLIDASQRELIHTGYTSNRARQNVANFLAKHLGIDWRYGAEWYEMLLVDYDVSSNWGNWQYVAGVGNDPRGDERMFNPVKQAFDYDPDGRYVRSWVPELSPLGQLENVFQAWTASEEDIRAAGLEGNVMVTDPILRIPFWADWKPRRRKGRNGRRGGRSGGDRGGVEGDPVAEQRRSSSSVGGESEISSACSPSNRPPSAPAAGSNSPYARRTYSLSAYSAPAFPPSSYYPAPYMPPTYAPIYPPVAYTPPAYVPPYYAPPAYAPPIYGPGGGRGGGFQGQGQSYYGGRGGYFGGGRGGGYRGGRGGGGYRGRHRGFSTPVPPSPSAA